MMKSRNRTLRNGTELTSPLIYDGVAYPDYWIDKESGNIWSTKTRYFKLLTPRTSGGCRYPRLQIESWRKDIMVHKAVAETLLPIPRPETVTQEEWDITPDSVKTILLKGLQVHHIDGDNMNYRPDNLERKTYSEHQRTTHV